MTRICDNDASTVPCPHFRGGPRDFDINFKSMELIKIEIKEGI